MSPQPKPSHLENRPQITDKNDSCLSHPENEAFSRMKIYGNYSLGLRRKISAIRGRARMAIVALIGR